METIRVESEGRFTKIILNRPDKRNALNAQMVAELSQEFQRLSKSAASKVVMLTGEGKAFCAGADLESLQELQQADHDQNLQDSEKLASLFQAMYDYPGLIFGAINGHALAGGCGLVTMCDIAIAHDNAQFGYTETRIGFVPAIVTRYLLDKISLSHANRLLLSAQIISAKEAQSIGLVHEVAEELTYDERVDWWIDHLMHELSMEALLTTKKLIRLSQTVDRNTAHQYAIRLNAAARMSNDCRTGIQAFLNKEKLRWT
jgi:methylglutaconyl-CoA hydratase